MAWTKKLEEHLGAPAWSIFDEDGERVAVGLILSDARIAEAAPDLLAAARKAAAALHSFFGPVADDGLSSWGDADACEAWKALDAAITKAGGAA